MVESYLVFVAASAGLTLLPGPNVTLLVAST
jgi:threonine/homoserine/homoserine lactone efflux protein